MFWGFKHWWKQHTQQKRLDNTLSSPDWFQYTTFQDLASADSVVVIEPFVLSNDTLGATDGYLLTVWKDRFISTPDGGLWFRTIHAALGWCRVRGI